MPRISARTPPLYAPIGMGPPAVGVTAAVVNTVFGDAQRQRRGEDALGRSQAGRRSDSLHGCAWVEEAVREAIASEVAHAEFPRGAVPTESSYHRRIAT